tara:strand:- start:987 stop:1403 length:417 start_codon:yes stop_codon:yes gene_type:complete
MLSQLLLLSHCILAPMGPHVASGAPRAVLSAASLSTNNPAMCPFLPDHLSEPLLDDFALSPSQAFDIMHPPTIDALEPARAIAQAFASQADAALNLIPNYTIDELAALLLQNQVHIAALIYAIIVVAIFVPFEDTQHK